MDELPTIIDSARPFSGREWPEPLGDCCYSAESGRSHPDFHHHCPEQLATKGIGFDIEQQVNYLDQTRWYAIPEDRYYAEPITFCPYCGVRL